MAVLYTELRIAPSRRRLSTRYSVAETYETARDTAAKDAVHSIRPRPPCKTWSERWSSIASVRRSPPMDAAGKDELVGIITERDILHACGAGRRPLAEVKVAEAMSTTLVTGAPDDEVESIMGLMTTHRIRHLPVLVEGRLAGMISIGDVVKAQHDRLAMENRFMKDYIGSQR